MQLQPAFSLCLLFLLPWTAHASCTGSSASLPAKECAAWQDFYDALQGTQWNEFCSGNRDTPCDCTSGVGDPCKGGPSSSSDIPDGWKEPDAGVCCTGNHITQLAFALNGLNGTLPASMNDLEELINFSACGDSITGQIPDLSGTKLKYLRLYRNKITGTIPESLALLTQMEFLSLGDNFITGTIPDLSKMTQLSDLYLDCNGLTDIKQQDFSRVRDKCFVSASTLLERCSKPGDNNFTCSAVSGSGADKYCHAVCK